MDGNKDYENFLERMDSVDWTIDESMLDSDEEETIEHYGVKGMKWGVRRYQPYPKGQRNAGKFLDASKQTGSINQNRGKSIKVTKDSSKADVVKAAIRSKGREISMVRATREIKNLSTKDAQQATSRAQLETRLKRLSETKNVGDDQAKRDYLNRASMSNEELKRKTDRLQLAENMRQSARESNKDVIEIGKQAVKYAAPVVVSYAVQKLSGMDTKVSQESLDKASKSAAKFIEDLI